MSPSPVILCLPIADRQVSFAFYRDGLGLEPFGEPAEDGVPELLQFDLNPGLRIMLIPTGGFGWVIGDHQAAPKGTSECIVSIPAVSDTEVDEVVERAGKAGATVVTEPIQQPWGYEGTFADPDGHLWQVLSLPSQA